MIFPQKFLLFYVFLLSVANDLTAQSGIPFMSLPANATKVTANIPPSRNIVSDGHPGVVDIVSSYMLDATTQVWCINHPDVTLSEDKFPEIIFRKGDVVRIAAGGRVQTGGHGLTSKRYVTPIKAWVSSVHSQEDDQYFGSISIPGVIPEQKLSAAIKNGPFSVSSDPGQDAFLRLKYADDGYGDNGYWNQDWGWYDQCRGMEDAWVVIIIKHNCAGSFAPGCQFPAPMDLVSSNLDPNGLELNPFFGWQITSGLSPSAAAIFNLSYKDGMPQDDLSLGTNQRITTDTKWYCIQTGHWGAIYGHINWFPVTDSGTIVWSDHGMLDRAGDDDYNLHLSTFNNAGYTTESSLINVEFNGGEIVKKVKSRWWKGFHDAVDEQDNEIRRGAPVTTHPQIYLTKENANMPVRAIVLGMFSLDFEHSSGWTELHPAYVLAFHVKSDPNDDVWTFFARNWGDEGFCGSENQPLNLTSLSILLPPPLKGYSNPQRLDGNNLTEIEISDPGMSASMVPDKNGAIVNFNLLPPEKKSLIDGELHIKWQLPEITGPTKVFSALASNINAVNFNSQNINTPVVLKISNPSNQALQIGQIKITGPNADAFSLENAVSEILPKGTKPGAEICSNRSLDPNATCSMIIACTKGGATFPQLLSAEIHIPVVNSADLIIPIQAQQFAILGPIIRH